MYTLKELNTRLDYLQSLAPLGGKHVIVELRNAITSYMTRDSDFELQVNKTLDKVIADAFFHSLEYENMDLIKKWMEYPSISKPEGYDNVADIFKCADVFEEIMAITDRIFKAAFYTKNTGSSDSSTTKYYNRYVDKWVAQLTTAITTELASLKAIMYYCANRSYSAEWAVLFEELGMNVKRHPVKYYAKQIYFTRSWGWLIETFNLNVYLPSYYEELPDWIEED